MDADTVKEKQAQTEGISREILRLSSEELLGEFPFLKAALSGFLPLPEETDTIAFGGQLLFYCPSWVIAQYRQEHNAMARGYFHMLLHYVFRHPFALDAMERRHWDLAADIAVEFVLSSLKSPVIIGEREATITRDFEVLRASVSPFTAEVLYQSFVNGDFSEETLAQWTADFRFDDHEIWYAPQETPRKFPVQGETDSSHPSGERGLHGEGQRLLSPKEIKSFWQKVGETMAFTLPAASEEWGAFGGRLWQNIALPRWEHYDYADFLRRFSTLQEVLTINAEEFDYIYYTYGLSLYKNMPLIEPLEYREELRVADLVIAIDTSGSCSGSAVQSFLEKTYHILSAKKAFRENPNIYIIQCDAEIQDVRLIASPEAFHRYLETMQIYGLGGTDYRPVFRYVDTLIAEGKLHRLRGLIYFTDGYGTFPEQPPAYEAAFVFTDKNRCNPSIPHWVTQVFFPAE